MTPPKVPPAIPPRLLSREAAAHYCGMSPSHFGDQVDEGALPAGRKFGKRVLWCRKALDRHLDLLYGSGAELPEQRLEDIEWGTSS